MREHPRITMGPELRERLERAGKLPARGGRLAPQTPPIIDEPVSEEDDGA